MGRSSHHRPRRPATPRRPPSPRPLPLLVIHEVGYIPLEAEAANLFFQLISSRYERASVIVTSNKPFGPAAKCSAFGAGEVSGSSI
jgi:hypothetical protein